MNLPPTLSQPRLLRLFKLIFYPLDYLEDNYQRYGDIFVAGKSETPFVYISNPQGIQTILTRDKTDFKTGGGSGFLSTLLGDNSIFTGGKTSKRTKIIDASFSWGKTKKLCKFNLLY